MAQPASSRVLTLADPEALLQALLAQMAGRKQADQPGIPGYELGKLLGQGGMGAVYLREQFTNFKYVKPVSDVWSMGAMLYFLLTTEFPRDFKRGADPMEVILRGNIVPVRKRDSSIPRNVADVIDRAVANKPADRYQTAAEFRDALAAVL